MSKYLCLRQDVYQPVTENGEDKTMFLQPGQEYELEGSELERLLKIGVVVLVEKPSDDSDKSEKTLKKPKVVSNEPSE